MTINERIRMLRKNVLKLNQRQFAQDLGMAQTGVSGMEQDGATVTDRVIKSICMAYNVNEDWLRTGDGETFVKAPTFSLDQFVRERGASELELEIMKAYFELDPEVRKTVLDHFKARFAAAAQEAPEPAAREPSVEELEAEYKKRVLNSASNTGHTALNTTEGTGSDGKASAG